MIKEALTYLAGETLKSHVVTTPGRTWIGGREVLPLQAPNRIHTLGTVAALCAYVQRWGELENSSVFVGPKGIDAFLDEEAEHRFDHVTVPFFRSDMPPERALSYQEFLLYLDQHAGHIEGEGELRALLRMVTVRKDDALSAEDKGAFVEFTAAAKRGVTAGSDTQPVQIPNTLIITLRLGTREYEEPHRFRLYGTIDDARPVFRLVHIDRDEALDRFLQRCLSDVCQALPGWHIYQAA